MVMHQATTAVVRKFNVIGIEDLNVRGMMANGKLSRAAAEVGMFEFRRQAEYKAAMHGVRIVVADQWYPPSRTCSDCGHIHTGLALSDRQWTCDGRGVIHDRDRNAAINLRNRAASSAATACGLRAPKKTKRPRRLAPQTGRDLRASKKTERASTRGSARSGLGLAAKVNRTAVKQEPAHGMFVPAQENGTDDRHSSSAAPTRNP
jgi:IS605 OrfB family transposase